MLKMNKCVSLILHFHKANNFHTGQEGIKVTHGVNFFNLDFSSIPLLLDTLTYTKNVLPESSSDGEYIK